VVCSSSVYLLLGLFWVGLNEGLEQPIANWAKLRGTARRFWQERFSWLLGGHSLLRTDLRAPSIYRTIDCTQSRSSKLATTRFLVCKLATARLFCFVLNLQYFSLHLQHSFWLPLCLAHHSQYYFSYHSKARFCVSSTLQPYFASFSHIQYPRFLLFYVTMIYRTLRENVAEKSSCRRKRGLSRERCDLGPTWQLEQLTKFRILPPYGASSSLLPLIGTEICLLSCISPPP